MADTVVVDKDSLGWAGGHEEEISNTYRRILRVGVDTDLPQRGFDAQIASYCKDNDCDLLTADKSSYTHFFEAGIKTIQISRYAWYKEGDRPIYLVKIVE